LKKGIEKNLWAKKFIKNIIYSKEEIAVTLYYKRDFEKDKDAISDGGWVGAAAVRNQDLGKRKSAVFFDASSNLAPDRESEQTVDIIIPNTIHGCKKKSL